MVLNERRRFVNNGLRFQIHGKYYKLYNNQTKNRQHIQLTRQKRKFLCVTMRCVSLDLQTADHLWHVLRNSECFEDKHNYNDRYTHKTKNQRARNVFSIFFRTVCCLHCEFCLRKFDFYTYFHCFTHSLCFNVWLSLS